MAIGRESSLQRHLYPCLSKIKRKYIKENTTDSSQMAILPHNFSILGWYQIDLGFKLLAVKVKGLVCSCRRTEKHFNVPQSTLSTFPHFLQFLLNRFSFSKKNPVCSRINTFSIQNSRKSKHTMDITEQISTEVK